MNMKQTVSALARAWFAPKRAGLPLTPRQRTAMEFYLTAAEARERAAPDSPTDEMVAVAVGLLRDSVICLLCALHHARHPEAELSPGEVPLAVLQPLLDEPGLLPTSAEDSASIQAALGETDCLAFDQMSAQDLERLKQSLERLARKLHAGIDLRTDAYYRWLGVARSAAVALLLVYGIGSLAERLFRAENVALGKPVKMSSRHPGTPDPSGLVDGAVGGTYGAHTQVGGPTPPWIVVDLQRSRNIRRIVVYNRGDVNLDQCLPYSVLVSDDGVTFRPFAKRETHFGSGAFLSSPWTIDRKVRARFVRIEARDYIALSELQVFE